MSKNPANQTGAERRRDSLPIVLVDMDGTLADVTHRL